MKKYLLFIFPLLLLSCSASYQLTYQLNKPEVSKDLVFKDSIIDISFNIGKTNVSFNIKNLTKEVIKLIWDESTINIDGQTKRIFHSGVKYIERNNPQVPSIISPNASLSDLMTPTENVTFISGKYGGWIEYDLFPYNSYGSQSDIETKLTSYKGKTMEVLLTLEKNYKKFNYIFEFLITDFLKKT